MWARATPRKRGCRDACQSQPSAVRGGARGVGKPGSRGDTELYQSFAANMRCQGQRAPGRGRPTSINHIKPPAETGTPLPAASRSLDQRTHARRPRTTTPAVHRAYRPQPTRAPPGSGAPGGYLGSSCGAGACGFGKAAGARDPMPGSRAGHGFRGRQLRGRGARGGPSSPAALPHRGERRHREREGKGPGGPGPAAQSPHPAPQLPSSAQRPPWVGVQAGSGGVWPGAPSANLVRAPPPPPSPVPPVAVPVSRPRPGRDVRF